MTMQRLFAILIVLLLPATVCAKEATSLKVSDAWATASLQGSETAAAYMNLENTGDAPIRITDVDTPNAHAMLHSMTNDKGVMRMRHVDDLVIPPHQIVKLEKHGLHIMLMHMDAPLKEGDTLPLTFTLSGGDTLNVSVPVKAQQ